MALRARVRHVAPSIFAAIALRALWCWWWHLRPHPCFATGGLAADTRSMLARLCPSCPRLFTGSAPVKVAAQGLETFLLFVGSKQSGKTTLITQFLNRSKRTCGAVQRA